MPTQATQAPAVIITDKLVNDPNPQIRASQAQNLNRILRWLIDQANQANSQELTGAYAPSNVAYVTIGNTSALSAERAIVGVSPVSVTDGGANANVSIGLTEPIPPLRDSIELDILGADISIKSNSYLAATEEIEIPGGYTMNEDLSFRWSADKVGTASYRLYDRMNSLTILSGTKSSPFVDEDEVTNSPGTNWPAGRGRIALEVKHNNASGVVQLTTPVYMVVQS